MTRPYNAYLMQRIERSLEAAKAAQGSAARAAHLTLARLYQAKWQAVVSGEDTPRLAVVPRSASVRPPMAVAAE